VYDILVCVSFGALGVGHLADVTPQEGDAARRWVLVSCVEMRCDPRTSARERVARFGTGWEGGRVCAPVRKTRSCGTMCRMASVGQMVRSG
jgi:hypothetical protein